MQLALYVLLLDCPGGIPMTHSQAQTLTQRLTALYQRANPNVTPAKARKKSQAALNPTRFSELVSFINSCLAERTPSAVVGTYQVGRHWCERTGRQVRHVDLPRELVEDRAGALTGA